MPARSACRRLATNPSTSPRYLVQPLRIIDQAQLRPRNCRVGQHRQRREADQEPVRQRTVHRPVVSCAGPLVPPSLTPGRAVLQPVQPLTGGPLAGDNMA